ncbi:MAG: hypothetical protein AVDCRST_MAG20-2726, partial [uncultured Acidimicrobiales bacterium]
DRTGAGAAAPPAVHQDGRGGEPPLRFPREHPATHPHLAALRARHPHGLHRPGGTAPPM